MTSQAGEKITTMHTLPNISKSKGNQRMKFTFASFAFPSCKTFQKNENRSGTSFPASISA